jgi:dTMP kinase
LEGVEGAGKSTNLAFMQSHLEARGVRPLVTREPGGTPLAEEIRRLIVAPRDESVDVLTETLLVFAARAQHLRTVIEPAMAAGQWVLCDRFTDATYAYQGAGRGLPRERIALLERLVQDGLRPDLTIYLDLPAKVGLERIKARADSDRFEQEQREFFDRVRNGYLAIAREDETRVKVVDATRSLGKVQKDIVVHLDRCLELWQA